MILGLISDNDMKENKLLKTAHQSFKKLLNIGRKNSGATMIVAIVIMAILVVFTFSLTLVAYTLYSSQNKNVASTRCAEAANTLSKAIGDELTHFDVAEDEYPEYDSHIYQYVRYNICQDNVTWPYYDIHESTNHDKDSAFRYFELTYPSGKQAYDEDGNKIEGKTVEYVEGLPRKTIVCMYWMLPDGVSVPCAKTDLTSREGIRLVVEVTCEVASQSYTVHDEYELKVSEYNLVTNISDRSRHNHLFSTDMLESNSINPAGFVKTELYENEKWEWEKSYQ